MYSALVVDDEKLIRLGMQKIVHWEDYGFSRVFIASSAQEAKEILKVESIDLLLTDVQMPKQDGLSLLKDIQKRDIIKIILSGYNDFEYAQQGMEFGAKHYLLKPVDRVKLAEILKQSQKLLDERKTQINKEENRRILKLLKHAQLLGKDSKSNVPSVGEDYYQLYLMKHVKKDLIYAHRSSGMVFEEITSDLTAMMIWAKSEKEVSKQATDFFSKVFDEKSRVDLSRIYKNKKLILSRFQDFKLNWIKFELYALKDFQYINGIEKDENFIMDYAYYDLLKFEDGTDYIDVYRNAIEFVLRQENDAYSVKMILSSLYARMLEELIPSIKMNPNLIEHFINKFNLEFSYFYSIDDILENVKIRVNHLLTEGVNQDNKHPRIARLARDVHHRYYEDLSIQSLAHQYGMNPAYLGQLFQQEMGISFNEYLNSLRLERAYEMINFTTQTMSEISSSVGFNDVSYFYRKFKEKYGHTPRQIRERKL